MTDPGPHAVELTAELRQLADALLDWVEPRLVASAQRRTSGDADTCGWCPVCALVAAVRGERTELGRRFAEQGSGVLAAVRALLDEHGAGSHAASHGGATPGAAPRVPVQPIPVRRREAPR